MNDYAVAPQSLLFSTRNEDRKSTRFKKTGGANVAHAQERTGYGKKKYSSQKSNSISSTGHHQGHI